ncbi:MAG: glycosyltransferase [bacterium]
MKILLVSPQNRTIRGAISDYCKRGLEFLGNEVYCFDLENHPYAENKVIAFFKKKVRKIFPSLPSPYEISAAVRSLSDKETNKRLIAFARLCKPDLVLVFLGENISAGTIDEIKRETGTVCVNWIFDTLLLPYRREIFYKVRSAYDYIFLVDSTEILSDLGGDASRIMSLPLGCDIFVHKKMLLSENEMKNYGSDVAFVGTVTPEREKFLEKLTCFDLKIWGRFENCSPGLKHCLQKKDIYAGEAVKVYNASKIIIDHHILYGRKKNIFNVTPRVFEVPASGGFLLTPDIPHLREFYKAGEEIIVYHTVEELVELVRYYLSRPEEIKKISEKAYQRAHKEHTYQRRLKYLLEAVS